MAEHIQTTKMRRLPTVFGICATFSDEILDVKRFAQVLLIRLGMGECAEKEAKSLHEKVLTRILQNPDIFHKLS